MSPPLLHGGHCTSREHQEGVQELDFTFDGKFSFRMEQMYARYPVLNSAKEKKKNKLGFV